MKETKASIGKIISLQKMVDPRGNLSIAEGMKDIPFNISRVYWTYDVPSGACRGGHAHKHCREFIIAVSGSFTVTLDNGRDKQSFLLNHPYQGLLVETDTWRTLDDFSSGAVCLVLAEDSFEENDYIREYTEFLNYKCSKKG
ncbi:MAG: WxcM-like domain-containing protein [Prevotella sp.]|jgi:wxcM-like protein|uniref:sugar 3,4-ketoisomerase n=1 Tax=Prevotella sp. TaxID=59823 RepID=UPI001CB16C16|nr:FdtA/QdtA family cupin domain-containing protein [Prevotella sp.]MBF1583552.1 WxcM-like domain-containing protein [Prevotella sp.]MBF1592967.1 WxcM-like domain-containing protein [Prevotella sp.]MBF1598919.1 WxcM-like domain-containing protein [Prevotella sp.]MBF1609431.1 WxcM-like domain-containing protein [Prevotella sp.]